MNAEDRFTEPATDGIVGVNELRLLRRSIDLSQREFADVLNVPVNTLRMWDSGVRCAPARIMKAMRSGDAAGRRKICFASTSVVVIQGQAHHSVHQGEAV